MFRLRRDAVITTIRDRAERLVSERLEVREVRLFGSLARGDAVPGSDADLLLVLRDAQQPFLDRIGEYATYFTGAGIGCEILAYTEAELARLRREGNPFVQRAWSESLLLASVRGMARDQHEKGNA